MKGFHKGKEVITVTHSLKTKMVNSNVVCFTIICPLLGKKKVQLEEIKEDVMKKDWYECYEMTKCFLKDLAFFPSTHPFSH